ncbi:unnamed protein product [Cuscuta campestris]|uniref:LOB domain-containing protein n=1 Tax=Cuscuta campestris TaxID=132261 RepID=A0A484M1H6_9ASTE|nr:unnamed protein product [Cuscuta campestris]
MVGDAAQNPASSSSSSIRGGEQTSCSSAIRPRGSRVCAACSHQRRRCPPDCPLAPYFPACKRGEFLNAHRLFGIKNLTRSLASIEEEYRDDFMVSIIYEANARAADPAGGCQSTIKSLYDQLRCSLAELRFVNQQLAFHRSRHHEMQLAAAMADFGPPLQPARRYDGPLPGRVSIGPRDFSEAQSLVISRGFACTDSGAAVPFCSDGSLKSRSVKF